jgi:hypothetical protein
LANGRDGLAWTPVTAALDLIRELPPFWQEDGLRVKPAMTKSFVRPRPSPRLNNPDVRRLYLGEEVRCGWRLAGIVLAGKVALSFWVATPAGWKRLFLGHSRPYRSFYVHLQIKHENQRLVDKKMFFHNIFLYISMYISLMGRLLLSILDDTGEFGVLSFHFTGTRSSTLHILGSAEIRAHSVG